MSDTKIQTGKSGEDEACVYLTAHGYRIRERNVKFKNGEIDIVAQEGRFICFIEVKTRSSEDYGSPFEAVAYYKQRKLSRLALTYLKYKQMLEASARFDVVAVLRKSDGPPQIDLVKNAFEFIE